MTFRVKKDPATQQQGPVSPEQAEAFEKVRSAVLAVLPRVDPSRITTTALMMDVGIDSLKVIELTLALEENFGDPVSLPDWLGSVDDPRELTFGSLADFLCRTLGHT